MLHVFGELLKSGVDFLLSLEKDVFVDISAIAWGRVIGCGGSSEDLAIDPLTRKLISSLSGNYQARMHEAQDHIIGKE